MNRDAIHEKLPNLSRSLIELEFPLHNYVDGHRAY